MKRKQKYSLTAKERKAMRAAGLTPVDTRTPEEIEADNKAAALKRKKTGRIVLIVAAALVAVALITIAIVLPIQAARNKYDYIDNPVAVVTLDNGMTMKYEIFEDTCPVAATNFLFLAKIGFFDGTIIFDSQNNWVRFGGFEGTSSSEHRKNNESFCQKITGLKERNGTKFGYRLKKDTSSDASKLTGQAGVLCFLYSDTATEFQVTAVEGAQTNVPGTTLYKNITAVGRAIDDQTLSNVAAIAALDRVDKDAGETSHTYWRAPKVSSEPLTLIKIQSVKLYNMNKKKWKNFNFDEYMSTIMDGSSALSN